MPQVLTIIFASVIVILTIVLAVVGIQLILVLREFKFTINKINQALDNAELKLNQIVQPLQNLGGIAVGLKTGIKVFEGFVQWLSSKKQTSTLKE